MTGGHTVRAVFGAVARGDDAPPRDLDLLVDVVGNTAPWFPGSGHCSDSTTQSVLNDLAAHRLMESFDPI